MPGVSTKPSLTVEIVGEEGIGKATLVGNLLYKCGGVDLLMLEKLQKAGINKYDQIARYLLENDHELSFESRRYSVSFTPESLTKSLPSASSGADMTIYMINPDFSPSSNAGEASISLTKRITDAKKLLTAVNKMDANGWSEDQYHKATAAAACMFKDLGVNPKRTSMIPISALHGDNLIEPSGKAAWFSTSASRAMTIVSWLDQDTGKTS